MQMITTTEAAKRHASRALLKCVLVTNVNGCAFEQRGVKFDLHMPSSVQHFATADHWSRPRRSWVVVPDRNQPLFSGINA